MSSSFLFSFIFKKTFSVTHFPEVCEMNTGRALWPTIITLLAIHPKGKWLEASPSVGQYYLPNSVSRRS